MIDLSLCVAGIRPHFWKQLYESSLKSCTKYSYEMIFIGPTNSDFTAPNIKFIEEWSSPVKATQIGALNCSGKFITFPCDDGLFIENSLDKAVELAYSVNEKDGIVMRYKEGAGMNAPSFPDSYWDARSHVGGIYIENHWKIAPQPMLSLEYFKELGGVDCDFECMAFATHDLCYRMQRDGSVFHLSPLEVQNADNYGTVNMDHAPIYYAQTQHDQPMFYEMYRNPNVKKRIKIDINNWKNKPDIWSWRWTENKEKRRYN